MGLRTITSVIVELYEGDTIEGRVLSSAGHSRSFHGWLELAGMLEQARAEAQEPVPSDSGAAADHASTLANDAPGRGVPAGS